ncbi:MAG TPA: gluconokinase [Ktedonobacteraceae bacterium]
MTEKASSANPNPVPPYILALDVGTSSTRALLFDAAGDTLPHVLAQRPYKLTISNEGEVSVDPDDLVAIVSQTIDDALEMAGPLAKHIGAVAIDTFWHGLMGVNAGNRPLTPLILWEDTRPHDAAVELRKQLDEAAIHARTGARLHASYWPAKLRWLATQEPDTFSHVAQWLSFGEYLYRHFLGRSVCSLSMASGTGMLHTRARAWDTELIKVLDVRPEQFPLLGDLPHSVQGLTPGYASAWPALSNVPWFPATGDGAAACIGSGCANMENWSLTIGTSSAMRVVLPLEEVIPPPGLWLYLIDAKRAVLGGALSEGGNMLYWLDSALKLPSLADAENLVAALLPDGHGLTILPFISGERSLGWHANARMTINGIHAHISPADILRAGMESLAYQLAAVYEQLCNALQIGKTVPRIIGSGGALLGSMTLEHIVADTLGVPVYPSLDHEASARGAALLALEAMDILPDVAQAPPHLKPPVKPDAEKHVVYRKGAERQQKLYQALLQVSSNSS